MTQALVTSRLGATATRNTRVRVAAQRGRKFIDYDEGRSEARNMKDAAQAVCEVYGWRGTYVCGHLPNGSVAWVCVCRTS